MTTSASIPKQVEQLLEKWDGDGLPKTLSPWVGLARRRFQRRGSRRSARLRSNR